MDAPDTIATISSPIAPALRIIVRTSGPQSPAWAARLGAPRLSGGDAVRCKLQFSEFSVPTWVYFFAAPQSYSGEDIVEYHLPGNPLLARMLLEELLRLGGRAAEPGEFTARAYFNGRMDLSAAEGVAATVAAHSQRELSSARALLSGELARRLAPIMQLLSETLGLVELGIDFSDQDVSVISSQDLREKIALCDARLQNLLSETARFERLTHEPRIVLAGRPNAGKSTLLNALCASNRAIVSPVAGTTRDVLWSQVRLKRGSVHIADLAGLEDGPAPALNACQQTTGGSPVPHKMREHALSAISVAEIVVLIEDATDSRGPLELPRSPDLRVRSKADLLGMRTPVNSDEILVSALSGEGLEQLQKRLEELCFGATAAQSPLALNARHVHAIGEARAALQRAVPHVDAGAEVLALELRESLDCLGQILGRVAPEDVLRQIFSSFCIGK